MNPIEALVARKNYPKALEVIRAELAKRPYDRHLRLQHADVLILSGRGGEAAGVLMKLADEQAADGFAAQAVAVLKRIEKIAPGRRDVEDRLARLIKEKARSDTPAVPRASAAPEIGLEEFDPSVEIQVGTGGAADEPMAGEAIPEPPAIQAEPMPIDDDLEGLDLIALEPEPETPESAPAVVTPLLEDLSHDELLAVIRGLKLLSFAPGDVLVAEGAPGDSLFILVSGTVKAFVKDPRGHYAKLTELTEGAFFGEISVLTGRPRTATITAATTVEVLELDKATLDEITRAHPRVLEVLREFHEKRASDTVQALVRGRG